MIKKQRKKPIKKSNRHKWENFRRIRGTLGAAFGLILLILWPIIEIHEWHTNNNSPVITASAELLRIRRPARGLNRFYFNIEGQERLRDFRGNRHNIGTIRLRDLRPGDSGEITFQGSRFINFSFNE